MPRRRNDPLGVSDDPIVVTDPEREAAVLGEFKRRLEYLTASYQFCPDAAWDARSFNRSLARLKRAVGRPKIAGRKEARLDPRLEFLITHRARKLAGLDSSKMPGPAHEEFVQRAAAEIVRNVQPIRGRPANERLHHHVEGLMALIQETCGKPVLGLRDKNSVYDPQLPDGVSRTVAVIIAELDPTVTSTQLVGIIRAARRKYANKRMRFRDFFPFYGGSVDAQSLVPIPGPHHKLEHFELAAPIYCP